MSRLDPRRIPVCTGTSIPPILSHLQDATSRESLMKSSPFAPRKIKMDRNQYGTPLSE